MKKVFAITALLILALGALVLPAAAQSDFSTLTQFFPTNAPLYLGFRTDDAFVQSLDSLATKFSSLIPGGVMPGSLQKLLDQRTASLVVGGTFATSIRPWLGNSAAIGLYSSDLASLQSPNTPVTIAIQITDQDQAEAFFDGLRSADQYTTSEGTGYKLYSPKSSDNGTPYVIFRSDAVVITSDPNLVQTGGVLTASLAQNPDYTTAVGMLPAASYGGIAYIDTPTLLNVIMQQQMATDRQSGSSDSSLAAMNTFLTSMLPAVKPEAVGLTLLDNHSITLDVAAPLNPHASSPLTLMTAKTPVDLAFAQHIPTGTPLVIQGTDLYHNGQAAVTNLRALVQSMPANANMRPQDVETALWAAGFAVRGLTGLEVNDAFSWMTSNYALYLGFTPAFSDSPTMSAAMQHLPVDFGIAIQATDAAAAQKVYDGLARSLVGLPAQGVSVTEETLADGTKALNFRLSSPTLPYPLEFLAATGNGVFVFGTRRMVTAALDPHNNGLNTDPGFLEATKYMVSSPNSFFYLNGGGLQPLARMMTGPGIPLDSRSTGKQLKALLSLISSASLSASSAADGSGGVARLVWTLPQ